MTSLWCVRAEFGTYAKQFVEGGYVSIGWMPNRDLSGIKARDELYPLYQAEYPEDTSNSHKLGSKVNANTVKQLRQAIPFGGQGAFITTADYQGAAADVALEAGFPRIGLINGRQLVDLLIEHWSNIPPEFRERLGLKPGLVRV